MDRWSLRCGWLLPLVVCLASVSCGSNGLNPVQGKVLYKGQPLNGAMVRFLPENRTDANVDWPIGMTDAEGSFTLKTGEATGAPAGAYKVTIVCLEKQEAGKQGGGMGMGGEEQDKLKGAYANPEKSSLSVEVKPGTNELPPFDLK